MKIQVQELIDFITDAGYEVGEGYSGRGMYGDTCVSITISRDDNEAGVVAAIMTAAVEGATDLEDAVNKTIELGRVFADSSTDSMGRDTILYFPRMKTSYRP